MPIIKSQPSGVYTTEIDLSQVITSASSSVAAQVIVSRQGSTEPKFFSNGDDYLAEYGNPDAQISFDTYCGLDYFREGNQLWAVRVAGEGALTSCVALCMDKSRAVSLVPVEQGIADPNNIDWEMLLGSDTLTPVALFYPNKGPGSYGDRLAIGIQSANASPFKPEDLSADTTNEGYLPAGTYQYQVSKVLQGGGETLVSNPIEVVIASSDQTNSVTLSFEQDPLAIGYKVYGRTKEALGLLATLGSAETTFIDDGTLEPDTSAKPITNPNNVIPASNEFTVRIFDLDYNTSTPVEEFVCTLQEAVDSSGIASELTSRINPYSKYIKAASNVVSLDVIPEITNLACTAMAGGDSGAAPTAYDVARMWSTFENRQLYSINILINGGKANPIVQKAMIELAEKRGDCVAMLDVPSASQEAQAAVDYRNLELNANTSYAGLFCPDVLEADVINGKQQYVPFSGWAAALCARTDNVANASYSIAGLNRGLLNVLKTRYTYDDGKASLLFAAQVNYTRTFVGAGIALWEQKTLQTKDSALSWISVRRIINVIKTALQDYLIYQVQEPNDDYTARAIESSVSDYLSNMQAARAISGFTVSTKTSAAEINSGIRNVIVVIIPMIPISQIQLQVVISKQGVDFSEVLSQVGG